jgi:hypothetical protein
MTTGFFTIELNPKHQAQSDGHMMFSFADLANINVAIRDLGKLFVLYLAMTDG